MAVKSAYREKPAAETPAPNTPEEKIQPSESVHINFDTKAEPVADEATLTLQNQIAHLKKSEDLQKQYAQHVAAQRAAQMAAPEALPSDPEARIALWRTQGLTDDDAAFMSEHLELAAEPRLTRIASDEAAQHHERDTDAFRNATLEAFHRLQGQQAQARPADAGGFVAHKLFGIEDDPEDSTVVHPDVVRIIGHGSLAKGRRVLEKFVAMLRRQPREGGVVLEHDGLQHDDGHHGWRVRVQR